MGHAHRAIEDPSSLMNDTLVLRCLAALLIVNSHLEGFYPIRQLAADGLLGDSLFFLLSGWGLVLSERRSRRSFPRWYARRSARLHPSIFLVVFLFDYLPHAGWSSWSLADYLLNFGWGRSYGFVGQILTFYVLFFGIMRCGSRTLLLAVLSALFLPYAALPILGRGDALFHAFHWVFYFQMMLFGGWLALSPEPIAPGGVRELVALLGLMSLYVATRVASASGRLGDAIFPPYLLIFPITYALLRLAHCRLARAGPDQDARALPGRRMDRRLDPGDLPDSLPGPGPAPHHLARLPPERRGDPDRLGGPGTAPGRGRRLAPGRFPVGRALERIAATSGAREPRRRPGGPIRTHGQRPWLHDV